MSYSRAHPSTRYLELQNLYRTMHEKGEAFLGTSPDKTFSGESLGPEILRIKELIERSGAQTILDYGSGKGRQYGARPLRDANGKPWPSVLDYWNVNEVVCYDPCYTPLSKLPDGKFDGVICTDVLEHCPEQDMRWIIEELFSYATRFVYASVANFPARKRLPNGENAHCTVKPAEWWAPLFGGVADSHAGVLWKVCVYTQSGPPEQPQFSEQLIGTA